MTEIDKLKVEEFNIRREMGKLQNQMNTLQAERMEILKKIDELEAKEK